MMLKKMIRSMQEANTSEKEISKRNRLFSKLRTLSTPRTLAGTNVSPAQHTLKSNQQQVNDLKRKIKPWEKMALLTIPNDRKQTDSKLISNCPKRKWRIRSSKSMKPPGAKPRNGRSINTNNRLRSGASDGWRKRRRWGSKRSKAFKNSK